MTNSTKCNFLYFISVGTTKYLVDMFIGPFRDHTRGFYYYWHVDSFKVSHYLSFNFHVFTYLFTYFIISLDGYDINCWHWNIN